LKDLHGFEGRKKPAVHCAGAWRKLSHANACLFLLVTLIGTSPLLYSQTPIPAGAIADVRNTPPQRAMPSNTASNMEYVIDADDVLDIYVVDVPEFSRNYRVGPDGNITIPLLSSPIMAEGLTLNQLSAVISDKLRSAGLVTHPHVVVSVKSSQAHAVAVTGAVQNPQIIPIFAPTTLLDVLSQAGGLSADAGSTAVITRGDSTTANSWLTKNSSAGS